MSKLRTLMTAAAVAAGLLAGAGARAEDPFKVGFVYVGPVGDMGWSYQHDQGRLAVEQAFGDRVETTYVEDIAEGPDAQRVINQLAATGHDMVFTTSFGFMNPTLKVAQRFPETKFEHATGFKRADNVSTYSSRFYEGRYVVGHIVGRMTKSNVIGYVGSVPIPEVVRGINATLLAARKVNPEVVIKVVWVNSWFDPGKEADAARTLIDQGADVIMQHTDSPAPVQVAEERGMWAVGQASDMAHFGPGAHLTAIVDDWAPYYVRRVGAAMDGTWDSADTWGGLNTGMVRLSAYNEAIPEDVVALAESVRKGIEDGSIHPFAGPIVDQDGRRVIGEGEVLGDEDLLKMNYYVEGVQGRLPK